ncbi:threonine/homoserine/homoserine lactone efflux protein [Microbacterium halimionae]|uniref:Threonine/homoserine/homoserine lactone efflux protein n=1 Tax=Microbacterium halimionae TaxID=1526413 RepID=A0A7W3JRK8_9MICO|nr:threonine/homoserine/homoserine lactone efflux protein [Microbacterium halimionae]NII94554.1 threonine/homoserine/homoserine lactone efflux protein [Microbacterium halimionae]
MAGHSGNSASKRTYGDGPPRTRGHLAVLGQGFIVGLTNPKTIAFSVAALPQFVDPTAGAVWLQLLLLGLIFEVIAVASDGT